jgi:single-stranded DNA-specific DHH superfamily exonuclease
LDGADALSSPVIILEVDVPIAVVGYVTSRLAEESGRPTIVIAKRDSELAAEARGPVGFNLVTAFASMRELFIGYGGHPRAAGFSMQLANAPLFIERMNEYVRSNPPDPSPRSLDAELPLVEATSELGAELERMWPFGQANSRPLLLSRGVTSEVVADAEARGVRFGTPVRIGERPADVVFRLRDMEGVPLVSIIDSIPSGGSGG